MSSLKASVTAILLSVPRRHTNSHFPRSGDPQQAFDDRNPFTNLGFHATRDVAAPSQAYDTLAGLDPTNTLLHLIGDVTVHLSTLRECEQ